MLGLGNQVSHIIYSMNQPEFSALLRLRNVLIHVLNNTREIGIALLCEEVRASGPSHSVHMHAHDSGHTLYRGLPLVLVLR